MGGWGSLAFSISYSPPLPWCLRSYLPTPRMTT